MLTLSEKELMLFFRENSSMQFVALSKTPWHAHNVDLAVRRLCQEEGDVQGVVFILPFNGKFLLSEDSFAPYTQSRVQFFQLARNEKVELFEAVKRKLLSLRFFCFRQRTKGEKFWVISPEQPAPVYFALLNVVYPSARLISIVVDEGLGLYMPHNKIFAMFRENGWRRCAKRVALWLFTQKFVSYCLKMKGNFYDWTLFQKQGRFHVTSKQREKELLVEVLADFVKEKKISSEIYENAVVFLTQPFVEEDEVLYAEYCKLMQKLRVNETWVHKPHPRERDLNIYEHLNMQVDSENKGISAECIFQHSDKKPRVVVGFSSTALVSAKLLWDIPAVSLIKLMQHKALPQSTKNDFEGFEKVFGEYVVFPKTIEELESFLS